MHINRILFDLIARGDTDAAGDLISSGADINGRTESGEAIWSYVVPAGASAVRLALTLGADPNIRDAAGRSALYWAVFSNAEDCAAALIEAGGRVDERDNVDKYNLLHEAVLAGAERVLAVLLGHASRSLLQEKNILGQTPYEEAVTSSQIRCASLLRQGLAK